MKIRELIYEITAFNYLEKEEKEKLTKMLNEIKNMKITKNVYGEWILKK